MDGAENGRSPHHKAMSIDHVFDLLGAGPIIGYQLRDAVTNAPEFLMVPRAVNALTERVVKALRRVQKASKTESPEEKDPPNALEIGIRSEKSAFVSWFGDW